MCVLSGVWLLATPWNVAHQAPLPMEFSRQEYWHRVTFPSPGDPPNPGIEPTPLGLLHWQVGSLLAPPGGVMKQKRPTELPWVGQPAPSATGFQQGLHWPHSQWEWQPCPQISRKPSSTLGSQLCYVHVNILIYLYYPLLFTILYYQSRSHTNTTVSGWFLTLITLSYFFLDYYSNEKLFPLQSKPLPHLPFSAVPLTGQASVFSNFPYNFTVQSHLFLPMEFWKICIYRVLPHRKPVETFCFSEQVWTS